MEQDKSCTNCIKYTKYWNTGVYYCFRENRNYKDDMADKMPKYCNSYKPKQE